MVCSYSKEGEGWGRPAGCCLGMVARSGNVALDGSAGSVALVLKEHYWAWMVG